MEISNPKLLLEIELLKPNPDRMLIEFLESLVVEVDPDLDRVGVAIDLGGVEVTRTDD